jgi:hypothetical protein
VPIVAFWVELGARVGEFLDRFQELLDEAGL